MRYWDASAVVPLLIEEAHTARASELLREEDQIFSWWGTTLECWSALCRLERSGGIDAATFQMGAERLEDLAADWTTVDQGVLVAKHARRLLRVHPLKTADALQLAACHTASDLHEAPLPFVTFDHRLAAIASKEGFAVVGI